MRLVTDDRDQVVERDVDVDEVDVPGGVRGRD
jgi:hypothetical protein